MARLDLTEEQKSAATSTAERIFIEASPGSGKTAVAAERFGVLLFDPGRVPAEPMVAVSFTRSATAELRRRVAQRWGTKASAWPNRIETIDSLLRGLLEYLLRTQTLKWPSGHTTLEVVDDWHGHSGFRYLKAGSWCRMVVVDAHGTVHTRAQKLDEDQWGFSNVGDVKPLLERGLATPRDVRSAVMSAFGFSRFRTKTAHRISAGLRVGSRSQLGAPA